MKKHWAFLFFFPFILLTCSVPLHAQTVPYIAANTIVKADTLNDSQQFERLGYAQQLEKEFSLSSPWVKMAYSGLDTSAQQLSIDIWFDLPPGFVSSMVRDFRSDTSLALVTATVKSPNSRAVFQFGKMTMKWNSTLKAFVSEGPLSLMAIGKKKINKQVNGYIMLERKRSGNVLSIYLENGKGGWYTFVYSNGMMLVYTTMKNLIRRLRNII